MRQTNGSEQNPEDLKRLRNLAAHNAREFSKLKDDLVLMRIESGQTQREVGDLLGKSQSAVAQFEDGGNDPRLSSLRTYALATGVRVTVTLESDARMSAYLGLGSAKTSSLHSSWDSSVSGTESTARRIGPRDGFVLAA